MQSRSLGSLVPVVSLALLAVAPAARAQQQTPPEIRVRVVRVSGGPRARIAAARRLVRDKRDELRDAFQHGLRRPPEAGLSVTVDLDIEVGDNGRVRTVTAANPPRDPALRRAIDSVRRVIRRWRIDDENARGTWSLRIAFDERPLLRPHRSIE